MKKILSILLCLMLAMLPMTAMAAPGDVIVNASMEGFEDMSINSFCAIGDTMYMVTRQDIDGQWIYAHKAGETTPVKYSLSLEVEDGYNQSVNTYLLTDGERLMLMVLINIYSDDGYEAQVKLYELRFNGDVAEPTLLCEPDWTFMRDEGESYYNYAERIVSLKEGMLIGTYNNMGDQIAYFLPYDGSAASLLDVENVFSICAYTDGKALIQQFDYEQPKTIVFQSYDPATGEVAEVGTVEIEEYEYFRGLTCDPQTGKTYFVKGGEIFPLDLATGEVGEAVADMPLDIYNDAAPVILEGGYLGYAQYNVYLLRNVNSSEKAQYRLKIIDSSYDDAVNKAYYSFANSHGDTSVILSREGDTSSLIDDMMNHSSDVDIYVMSTSQADFEAVMNRGYVADFSGSAVLSEMAEKMPAQLREQLSANGGLAALPVNSYFWLPWVNTTALEALNMTVEDLPTNWYDFMDFLTELQQTMPQDGSVMLFDPWTSATYARRQLFDQIFSTYQMQLKEDPNAINSQTMVEIFQKLEQIDFVRLGQPDDRQMEDEDYNPDYDDNKILLTCNMGTGLQGIARDNMRPLTMSLTADLPVFVPMEMSVAFINPYSENPNLALEFMENLFAGLRDEIRYCIQNDLNEPTLNVYHDENVKYAQQYVDQVREQLENAAPVDKQRLEEELTYAEQNLEDVRAEIYAITEEDIAWLRAHENELLAQGSNWLYSDDNGEAYELVERYMDGQIDAARLMKEIDGKIRMMLMEGY